MVKPATKREIASYMIQEFPLCIRQACECLGLERSTFYYQPKEKDDTELTESLQELSEQHPSYGFRKMLGMLRSRGCGWNHKKVYRVYKNLGLNIIRKKKRRLACRERRSLDVPKESNKVWSMDFMSDSLFSGQKFRTLNLIDDFNREALWVENAFSIGALYMTNLLDWIVRERGKPQAIRVDNGPEFTSSAFTGWCHKHRIAILYIQPGKPVQNAYIERFNRTYRTEVLDARIFNSIIEVRAITQDWILHYNHERPHESLGSLSPVKYLLKEENSQNINEAEEFSPFQQI